MTAFTDVQSSNGKAGLGRSVLNHVGLEPEICAAVATAVLDVIQSVRLVYSCPRTNWRLTIVVAYMTTSSESGVVLNRDRTVL